MKINLNTLSSGVPTERFASILNLQPQSIRKRYSQTGSYFGVRPIKLPNRRLLWPDNALIILTKE